jgi:hypothetical protein
MFNLQICAGHPDFAAATGRRASENFNARNGISPRRRSDLTLLDRPHLIFGGVLMFS